MSSKAVIVAFFFDYHIRSGIFLQMNTLWYGMIHDDDHARHGYLVYMVEAPLDLSADFANEEGRSRLNKKSL
jgi:hypothetical protein